MVDKLPTPQLGEFASISGCHQQQFSTFHLHANGRGGVKGEEGKPKKTGRGLRFLREIPREIIEKAPQKLREPH